MSFRIGDRVRMTRDYDDVKKGMEGRVAAFHGDSVGVDFGPGFYGHDLLEAIPAKTGYWVSAERLELLPPDTKAVTSEPRPIKPGSKWRISCVGVTVKAVDDTVLAEFDGHETEKIEVSADAWRQIATWVSDPVETPKVGSWVRRKTGGATYIVADYDGWIPQFVNYVVFNGPFDPVEFEPCEPPPLVKALDAMADYPAYLVWDMKLVDAVNREWRALKAKIGGES